MASPTRIVLSEHLGDDLAHAPAEICEHKGVGHPDSLCDGIAEAVSRALCRAYLHAYGQVQHYNVDKALLVGGESRPRFGGGTLVTRLRLIVCGRATVLPATDMAAFVCAAAHDYLSGAIRADPDIFTIESAVRSGSPNLQRVVGAAKTRARANDTSFGAGFAPYSPLERIVLKAAEVLRSESFRRAFPGAGDDYKVMGARIGGEIRITVALAVIDRFINGVKQYFANKASMVQHLKDALGFDGGLVINALDDPSAADESGVYLTVTGLSAEHGDDGQVGRGNRVNGLITPGRTMSLEAAAGKNAVAHVGKIYNVLAHQIAQTIAAADPSLLEASVQLLSTIGKPVDQPELIVIRLTRKRRGRPTQTKDVLRLARTKLRDIDRLSGDLVEGRVSVF